MAARPILFAVALGVIACAASTVFAQENMTKEDALASLDELCIDDALFERIAARARTFGVSEPRIAIARSFNKIRTGTLDDVKRQLVELEKAIDALPAADAGQWAASWKEGVLDLKKIINFPNREVVQSALFKRQRKSEALAILSDLQRIDLAVDMCAIELNLRVGAVVPAGEWLKRIKWGTRLRDTGADIFGVPYGNQIVDRAPQPNRASLEKVSKYVEADFFDIQANPARK